MSLKDLLYSELRKRTLSLDEVHTIARMNNYKQSTAERALRGKRGVYNPVVPITNHKGHITGYRWRDNTDNSSIVDNINRMSAEMHAESPQQTLI